MEKKRHIKYFAIGAIAIAITSMGFSFATMSTQLDIKGFATMGSADWNVHFDNLSHAKVTGKTLEVIRPTITDNSTSITAFDVKFQEPMDAISYDFEIVNGGGMNAIITSVNIAKPNCKGKGEDALLDEALVCDNLSYTLTYLDGIDVRVGDTLAKGKSKDARLKLQYLGSELPIEEVRISDLGISVVYSQD